jgi:hypothetical protein
MPSDVRPMITVVLDAEIDPVVAHGVEDGPDLSPVLEPLLLDLLGGVGVYGLPREVVHLEPHGEHLADGGSRLGVAGAAALQPVPQRLLHGRRRHHHAPALPVHHVRRHVLERDEEAQHVPLGEGHGRVVSHRLGSPRRLRNRAYAQWRFVERMEGVDADADGSAVSEHTDVIGRSIRVFGQLASTPMGVAAVAEKGRGGTAVEVGGSRRRRSSELAKRLGQRGSRQMIVD